MMKLKKTILLTACAFSLSLPLLPATAAVSAPEPIPQVQALPDSAVPYADNVYWVPKVENGKLYKRLYNASTDTWIGGWVYVCEYPG